MKHKVKINVSDTPQTAGVVTCKSIGIRDRILRLLIGDKRRVTVLIPGDSTAEIAICEAVKGEEENGKSEIGD